MKKATLTTAAALVAIAVTGCGGSGSGTSVAKSGKIGVWITTSVPASGKLYAQSDRLARPAVNEVFATVANGRHEANDADSPPQDKTQLMGDIDSFLVSPANRSTAIRGVIEAVLVPDMMSADLTQTGGAYLGVETGGATGGKFGGRMLTDDVVKTSLGIIFGNTIPALGLAPDDGNEIPTLTDDHVTSAGKHFLPTFPYLGNPL